MISSKSDTHIRHGSGNMTDDFMDSLNHQAIAETIAHQNAIDREEAGPKAPHGAIPYKGVVIDSRWDVLSEYRQMREIVDNLPDLIRVRVQSIWCDSKCAANYIVIVKPGRFIHDLPFDVEDAVIAAVGGHNGITIQNDASDGDLTLDCHWNESLEE